MNIRGICMLVGVSCILSTILTCFGVHWIVWHCAAGGIWGIVSGYFGIKIFK